MVEKETTLAKAVSITKRRKKEKSSPPNKKTGPQTIRFFRKGLPWQVRGQAREELSTIDTVCRSKQGHHQRSLSVVQPDKLPAVQPTRPKTTLPRATTAHITISPKTPTGKVLEVLHVLPQTLGISLNMDITRKEAQRPVGAGLQHFLPNWQAPLDPKYYKGIQFGTDIHFKMEGIRTVKGLMRKGDWLKKLDLKDAYYSVPVNQAHTHFLRFQWQSQTYQFNTLPSGLSSTH